MHKLLAIALLTTLGLVAQEPPPAGGRPEGGRGGMMRYDATQEATFKGTVVDVTEQARGPMTVVTLVVKVEGKELAVNAGPVDFLKEKGFAFAKGDALSIVGVKASTPRGEMIQPREITKGKATLVLRDKDGRLVFMPRR